MSNQPSNILLKHANGEILTEYSSVVLSSVRTSWHNLVVEEHHHRGRELADFMFIHHTIAMNIGPTIRCEYKKDGRLQHLAMPKDSVSLSPSSRPFFRRSNIDENGLANVLYIALDPVFVSQAAAALEAYPDRVELMEQQRMTDPALKHIALALRAALQTRLASDRMYSEALSTALAVHLLREYGGIPAKPHDMPRGLSREKLRRAVEYIQDQLQTDLTVAGIARSVHMSAHHFTHRFKQATGCSPYRYVIEARVRKAKELLTSGNFSIIEVAHRVGFADQSHLTRHMKQIFGITPGVLLERRQIEDESSKEPEESSRGFFSQSAI